MNYFFLFLYEICLFLIAIITLPKFLFAYIVKRKYRKSFFSRMGFSSSFLIKKGIPSVWIHAVSVGETKAVASLARQLKERLPHYQLIISSVTETGHEEAKRSLPFADHHVYFPLDFRYIINKVMRTVSPKLVIFSESDFWFNFLDVAKKNGSKIALVNGKLSLRSMRRFHFFSFFSKRLFALFDVCCVQNETYFDRFIEAGVSANKMVVTGNLKLDDEYPILSDKEMLEWREKLGVAADDQVITIGSIHFPEEKILFPVLNQLWANYPKLRVILVPRRPEEFVEMGRILERERIRWINFSEIGGRTGKEQVILVNTMGLLRMCYQLSDCVIVCGSFTDHVGGHNILEPCWYGKPLIFGPHMHSQLELVDIIKKYGAGLQVDDDKIYAILKRWIDGEESFQEMGKRGLELVKDLRGSTKKTLQVLEERCGIVFS